VLFALAPAGCVSSCNHNNGPALDTCAPAGAAMLTRIEVADAQGSPETETFPSPLAAGGSVRLVHGIQGADMVVLRLRVQGPQVPGCLLVQVVTAGPDGAAISQVNNSLRIYTSADGSITHDIYLPGVYAAATFTILVSAGGVSLRLPVSLRTNGCADVLTCLPNCSGSNCQTLCQGSAPAASLLKLSALDSCLRAQCSAAPASDGGAADQGAGDMSSIDQGAADMASVDQGAVDMMDADLGAAVDSGAGPLSCTDAACLSCVFAAEAAGASCYAVYTACIDD
jgi:hypothetical protein